MSRIIFFEGRNESDPSAEKAIRLDLAWQLFFPKCIGKVDPTGDIFGLTDWLWREFGKISGFIRRDSPDNIYVLSPHLSDEGSDFVARISSFWSDEIYFKNSDGTLTGNSWKAPTVNLLSESEMDHSEKAFSGEDQGCFTRYIGAVLGPGRGFTSTYVIPAGGSYSRLHSHSAVDELYVVLEGSGHLRFNGHLVEIVKGTIISKPIGPDAYSQLLADKGERLKVLDIEIWPDPRRESKDLILYPDHKEILLRGTGWGSMIQSDNVNDLNDIDRHYTEGYERQKDGGWKKKSVPGFNDRVE